MTAWLSTTSAVAAGLVLGAYLHRLATVARVRLGYRLMDYAAELRVRRWNRYAAGVVAEWEDDGAGFGRRPAGDELRRRLAPYIEPSGGTDE